MSSPPPKRRGATGSSCAPSSSPTCREPWVKRSRAGAGGHRVLAQRPPAVWWRRVGSGRGVPGVGLGSAGAARAVVGIGLDTRDLEVLVDLDGHTGAVALG